MTTQEIVDLVKSFGDDKNAVFDALLEKLIAKEITMDEVEKAIGVGSEAFPYGYPHSDICQIICPSFLTVLSVALARANGNEKAFCC